MFSKLSIIFLIVLIISGCSTNSNSDELNNSNNTKVDYEAEEKVVVEDELLFAIDAWPPYIYKDEEGFLIVLVKEAFKAVDIKTKFEYVPWERALVMVENHSAVGSFPWRYTEERTLTFFYSEPLTFTRYALFHKKNEEINDELFNDIVTNPDYTIGIVTAYWYVDWLEDMGIQLDYSTTQMAAIEKLLNGRVDFALADITITYFRVREQYPDQLESLLYVKDTIGREASALIIHKDYPNAEEYIKKFDEGLRIIKSNGLYKELLDEYNIVVDENE